MTSNELRDLARLIEERISIHGRLIGAQLPIPTIAEASRLAVKCVAEAEEMDIEVKKRKPVEKIE